LNQTTLVSVQTKPGLLRPPYDAIFDNHSKTSYLRSIGVFYLFLFIYITEVDGFTFFLM